MESLVRIMGNATNSLNLFGFFLYRRRRLTGYWLKLWDLTNNTLSLLHRPDIAMLWFLIPFKAAKHLICDQYRWLTIKIVFVLLILAILGLFIYNMPGYMVKKMLGA